MRLFCLEPICDGLGKIASGRIALDLRFSPTAELLGTMAERGFSR